MTSLATFAPTLSEAPHLIPTGNLHVALPEIDRVDGRVRSLGVVLSSCAGVLTAHGGADGLARPVVTVDGGSVLGRLTWQRVEDWLPRFEADTPSGRVEARYAAPQDERGVVLRLDYQHRGDEARVELAWRGRWASTSVEHLRGKPVEGTSAVRSDEWTGSRVASLSAGLPLLALAWRGGPEARLEDDGSGTGWEVSRSAVLRDGDRLEVEAYLGVAVEPDGACTTALHLRRRGFAALWDETCAWLSAHRLPVGEPLGPRLNANLFFNYFYAQADTLDAGQPVLLTSRSPHYYVCAALWSRDAYLWTFPSLLMVDAPRARRALVSTLRAGGSRLPDHALYLNGTSLYPGFELDQAAAPILAVHRYVEVTGDDTVLDEAGVLSTLLGLVERVASWRHPAWDLYATFLLPTDDPTDHPYVTTCNVLLAAALDALGSLLSRSTAPPGAPTPEQLHDQAASIRLAVLEHLVVDGPNGQMLAWACRADGVAELRDEPPLSLRTAPFWGLGSWDDPVHVTTRRWLDGLAYPGPFAGAGSPHFPFPSGFDLANRLLDPSCTAPDPLTQLTETPMDDGLGCESWDAQTGVVTTGAAMASMAGLLVWCAQARRTGARRWDSTATDGDAS